MSTVACTCLRDERGEIQAWDADCETHRWHDSVPAIPMEIMVAELRPGPHTHAPSVPDLYSADQMWPIGVVDENGFINVEVMWPDLYRGPEGDSGDVYQERMIAQAARASQREFDEMIPPNHIVLRVLTWLGLYER